MIKVDAIIDDKGGRSFVVDIGDRVTDRQGLHQALGERYAELLQDHWRKKNEKPNKLGGRRTNFWAKAAGAVALASATETGAVIAVQGDSGARVGIHITGGKIRPVAAKALTIPLVAEAHAMRAAEYEQEFGTELFTIPGKSALFEKSERGAASDSTLGRTRRPNVPWRPGTMLNNPSVIGRRNVVPLRGAKIRAVFALAKESTIPADPDALPSVEDTLAALREEAEDWFDMTEGGAP